MRPREKQLAWVAAGLVLAGVLLDAVQASLRRMELPPEERAAIAKMMEIRRTSRGRMDNVTPEQWAIMQEFQRTRRLPPPGRPLPTEEDLPVGMRMQRIHRRSGGKWENLTAAERAFLKKQMAPSAVAEMRRKSQPAASKPKDDGG